MEHGNKMHGHTVGGIKSPTYSSWRAMKRRCGNVNSAEYPDYGGRGIKVCARWLNSFENFLTDMGKRPSGTSIDRYPNNNGNYEPGNCRWATPTQQTRNRRNTTMPSVTFEGITKCARDWEKDLGLPAGLISRRLARSEPVNRHLFRPASRCVARGFSSEEITAIRERIGRGDLHRLIAQDYHVDRSTISKIHRGETYPLQKEQQAIAA